MDFDLSSARQVPVLGRKRRLSDREPVGVFGVGAMRGIALGRNYLFAGSDTGGGRAPSLYTIVQTAKLNSMNPGPIYATR